ncbi:hypothetical protein F4703DRAFT_1922279 [Phycomyces blakesleeanus]
MACHKGTQTTDVTICRRERDTNISLRYMTPPQGMFNCSFYPDHIDDIQQIGIHPWLREALVNSMQLYGFKCKEMCFSESCQTSCSMRPTKEIDDSEVLEKLLKSHSMKMMNYGAFSINHLLSNTLCSTYPLIFSPSYAERLGVGIKNIPDIAHALQRIRETARQSDRTKFYDATSSCLKKIGSKYDSLKPHSDDIPYSETSWIDTTIGLYFSQKRASHLRTFTNTRPKYSISTMLKNLDSPNYPESI